MVRRLLMICTMSIVVSLVSGCNSRNNSSAEKSQESTQTAPAQPAPAPEPSYEIKENAVYVKLTTSMGPIVLELDAERAPVSTENFISYVGSGGYDGTIFHRVIEGFMIQGGGFEPDMRQRPTQEPIVNEWQNGLKNMKYTVAMARLGNRPDSATSQFFINTADNGFLDMPRDGAGYAVFGQVVNGREVVDAIGRVATGNRGGHSDVPTTPVVILKAEQIHDEG